MYWTTTDARCPVVMSDPVLAETTATTSTERAMVNGILVDVNRSFGEHPSDDRLPFTFIPRPRRTVTAEDARAKAKRVAKRRAKKGYR